MTTSSLPPKPLLPVLLLVFSTLFASGAGFDEWLSDTENLYQDLVAPMVVPIGVVQGPVSPVHNGMLHASPREGLRVTVQGVVHHPILHQPRPDRFEYGFFLQNTAETTDGDPATSDGIFVYLQTRPNVRMLYSDERYLPAPGDEIVLTGTVRELFHLTQLTAPTVREVLRTGLDLDTVLPPFEANPPNETEEAERYWERHEGMRAFLPAGSISQQGRKVHASTQQSFGVFLHPAHPVARRESEAHRRVFRDAHPLDNRPDRLFDDGNGFRIYVGSLGLQATSDQVEAQLPPLRTFNRLLEPVTGPVYQFLNTYSIQPSAPFSVEPGLDPFADAPRPPPPHARQLSIATFNVENLYDHRNDPDSLCDHPDDPGNEWIQPPFNYLPESESAYTARLARLAAQMVEGMHAPDLVLVQEVENQDMLSFDASGDVQSGADGALDPLQELCLAMRAAGGPSYAVAANRHGGDERGIICAFLYRPDRLQLIAAEADHPILGDAFSLRYATADLPMNREVANPKSFNAPLPDDLPTAHDTHGTHVFSRAVQLAIFQVVQAPTGTPLLYALNNHFSSRPNRRVDQRREQARLNALLTEHIQAMDPGAWVVVGGDLNTFPRPDEPDPHHPADQLGPLYEAGLRNLYDGPLADRPEWNYTYVFRGQAGTLDQLFFSETLWERLDHAWIAHLNADWAEGGDITTMFGASDHDAVIALINTSTLRPDRRAPEARTDQR